jgi:nitrous oxide reductase accessory protein NosL
MSRRGVVAAAVLVTDGVSGTLLDARRAWFVRTVGNMSDGAPDAIRVFAREEDALRHADAHGGRILTGEEHPFGGAGGAHAAEH